MNKRNDPSKVVEIFFGFNSDGKESGSDGKELAKDGHDYLHVFPMNQYGEYQVDYQF